MKVIPSTLYFRSGFVIAILFGLLVGFIEMPFVGDLFIGDAQAAFERSDDSDVIRYAPRTSVRRDGQGDGPPVLHKRPVVGSWTYTMPSGCIKFVSFETYWRCGVTSSSYTYYMAYYEGTTIVYVVVEEP